MSTTEGIISPIVSSLVGGMVAGADSIDDMGVLRHGAMGRLFTAVYAPSTVGSFLRKFTFGHVRQLDAAGSRFLAGLAEVAPLVSGTGIAMLDVDDTTVEVHGCGQPDQRQRMDDDQLPPRGHRP